MRSFHSSGGGTQVEQPMLPTQPPGSNGVPPSKRKTPEDGDPFGRSNKKAKADVSCTLSNARVCIKADACVDFNISEWIC